MSAIDLRADCARCAALCCVAFHFDLSDQFGFDKAAGEPCSHLDEVGCCGIYGRRTCRGFSGCVGYDCHGAGQWVTQVLFDGRSWLVDRALLGPMVDAFLTVERAHRLLVLLREAGTLDLWPDDRRRRDTLASALEGAAACAGTVAPLEAEVRSFLSNLRRYVTRRATGP